VSETYPLGVLVALEGGRTVVVVVQLALCQTEPAEPVEVVAAFGQRLLRLFGSSVGCGPEDTLLLLLLLRSKRFLLWSKWLLFEGASLSH
jgi:hypothetical protein